MEGRSGGWIEVSGEDILGKKLVDKSIFRHGTTIPKEEAHKYFSVINREYLQRGENEVVTLLIDGKEFKVLFRNEIFEEANKNEQQKLYFAFPIFQR